MKIRINFVSNSSSSSFTFVGRSVRALDITENDTKKNRYVVIGKGLTEGVDVFEIDSFNTLCFLKAFENLKLNVDEWEDDFFEIYQIFDSNPEDSNQMTIDVNKLPTEGEVTFLSHDRDYHSSTTYEDLLENYINNRSLDVDFFGMMETFKRKNKLKQLKNEIEKNG